MVSRTIGDYAANLFLRLGVACSLVMGTVGYISGSAPEWVVMKASVGLISFGIVGWLASAVVRKRGNRDAEGAKEENASIALAGSATAESKVDVAATT